MRVVIKNNFHFFHNYAAASFGKSWLFLNLLNSTVILETLVI